MLYKIHCTYTFVHSFIHSLDKHVLSTRYVSVLGAKDKVIKTSCLSSQNLLYSWESQGPYVTELLSILATCLLVYPLGFLSLFLINVSVPSLGPESDLEKLSCFSPHPSASRLMITTAKLTLYMLCAKHCYKGFTYINLLDGHHHLGK